jgi:tetratricopeptide (TPR) repeat protein
MKKTILSLAIVFLYYLCVYSQDMPKEAAQFFNEGNTLLKQGNFKGAIEKFEQALKYSDDYRIYYQKGIAYRRAGNIDQAEKNFIIVTEKKPDFEGAYNALGNVYFQKGDMQKAITNFEKVLELSKDAKTKSLAAENAARAYTKLAQDLLADGKHKQAIDYLNNAVEKNKYDAAFLLLSQAYNEIGEYDKAIEAADKALNNRKNVSKGGPLYYKGLAFKGKGDIEKAKEAFTEGLSDPKYKKQCEYELGLLK